MSHSTLAKMAAMGLAGACALALSSCGSTPQGSTDSGAGSSAAATGQNVRVWFMEGSIPDDAVKYLEDTFAANNPGNTLTVEIQPWDGIVNKLQTSLASDAESPDLVETGNTQTALFASVGAFAPLDDHYESLGGSKLISSFVEAGTWENHKYALPLYAGARGIYYRKDMLEKAGIAVPTTLDELAQAAIDVGKANPDNVDGFSGMYLAAVDIHGVESLMFAGGGDYAKMENDKWTSLIDNDASVASLTRIQKIFKEGTAYALADQASQKSFEKFFNENKVAFMVGTGNVGEKIDKALWEADAVGVMPIPGTTAGTVGQTFAGGSSISMAAKAHNPELAAKALEIIYSKDFQESVAKAGWTPGNSTYASAQTGAFSEIAPTVVANSKLTPNTPQWGSVAGDGGLRDFFMAIAQGSDVRTTAGDFSKKLTEALNAEQ